MKEVRVAREPSGQASPGLGRGCSGSLPGRGGNSTGKGGGDSERKPRAQDGTQLRSAIAQGGQRLPLVDREWEARPLRPALSGSSQVVTRDEEEKHGGSLSPQFQAATVGSSLSTAAWETEHSQQLGLPGGCIARGIRAWNEGPASTWAPLSLLSSAGLSILHPREPPGPSASSLLSLLPSGLDLSTPHPSCAVITMVTPTLTLAWNTLNFTQHPPPWLSQHRGQCPLEGVVGFGGTLAPQGPAL